MVATELLSVDDLERMEAESETDDRFELIRGELHEATGVGGRHGSSVMEFAMAIANFVVDRDLGHMYLSNTRFILARDPDTVVMPDVTFVRTARLPEVYAREHSVPIPPDFAAEFVSNGDTAHEVERKLPHYLTANVPMTVVVDLNARSFTVYRSGAAPERLAASDTFDGGDVLPEFRMAMADVFR